jgi:hypothetical protein
LPSSTTVASSFLLGALLVKRFLARYRELDAVHTGAGGNVKRLTVFGPTAIRRYLGRLDRAEMFAIG